MEPLLQRLGLLDIPWSTRQRDQLSCHVSRWRRVLSPVVGCVVLRLFLYCAYRCLNPALAGNGIQLSGQVTGDITYDLQLDGKTNSSISPSSGATVLATYDNLQPTNHTLSLTVHNPTNSSSALIAIYSALIKVNSTSPKCVSQCITCALRVHRILTLCPASLFPSPPLRTPVYRSQDAGLSSTTLRYLRWTVHIILRVMRVILLASTFLVRLPQQVDSSDCNSSHYHQVRPLRSSVIATQLPGIFPCSLITRLLF